MSLATLLYDPDAFFDEQPPADSRYRPILIVTLAGIANVLSPLLLLNRFSSTLPPSSSAIITFSFGIGIIGGFLSMYLGWIVTSGAVYYVANRIFDGGVSEFRSYFYALGWGFLPSIPGGILSAWAIYSVYYSVEMPSDPSGIQPLISSLSSSPIFTFTQTAVVALALWQGLLWSFAIYHTADLTLKQSTYVAGVPTVLVLLVQIFA